MPWGQEKQGVNYRSKKLRSVYASFNYISFVEKCVLFKFYFCVCYASCVWVDLFNSNPFNFFFPEKYILDGFKG